MTESYERSFHLQNTVEQKPFQAEPARRLFEHWCNVNDSIAPQFVSRQEWEQRLKQGMLQPGEGGKKNLYLPEDLQLWEMLSVVEVVDADTYAHNPEKSTEKTEQLKKLGTLFEHSGVYLAKRLPAIQDGKDIAEQLAKEFYAYGASLNAGTKLDTESIKLETIASLELTADQLKEVDAWLAGYNLNQSRRERALAKSGKDNTELDKELEAQRNKTLAQYFRILNKAYELEESKNERDVTEATLDHFEPVETEDGVVSRFVGRDIKPWDDRTSTHRRLLERIKQKLQYSLTIPERELHGSMLRRGSHKLSQEMPAAEDWHSRATRLLAESGFDVRVQERKMREVLKIEELKLNLEAVKRKGNQEDIADAELAAAVEIQEQIEQLPYRAAANNPSEMVRDLHTNCLGATLIGSSLLEELGIKYLPANIPGHSVMVVVATDGRVAWMDMLNGDYKVLEDTDFVAGKNSKVKPVDQIRDFIGTPQDAGLVLYLSKDGGIDDAVSDKSQAYKNGMPVTFFPPDVGQRVSLLINMASELQTTGQNAVALELYRQLESIGPNDTAYYSGYTSALEAEGRYKEALHLYQDQIALAPDDAETYREFGRALHYAGYDEAAIMALKQSLELDSSGGIEKNIQIGDSFRALRNFEQAETHYAIALQLAKDSDEKQQRIFKELGFLHYRMNKYQEAINDYMHLHESSKTAQDYGYIGACYAKIPMYTEAEEAFKKALGMNPGLVAARLKLGSMYVTMGRISEAKAQLAIVAKINDPEEAVWAGLATDLLEAIDKQELDKM